MSKKIFTMLSLALMLSLIPKFSFTVDASTTCSTKQECNDIISEAQSQISDLKSKEAAVQKEIDIVEGDMGTTIQKISETETAISEFEKKISIKENEIKNSERANKQTDWDWYFAGDDFAVLNKITIYDNALNENKKEYRCNKITGREGTR